MKNISLLDDLIIGRVEPHIYAFTTETYPNYLKVGDTYRPVGVRLKEWKNYFPDLQHQISKVAKVDEDTYFRDHAVHNYLEDSGKTRLDQQEAQRLNAYYSREFFKNTDNTDIEDAIKDIQESHELNDGKYAFYAFEDSRIPIEHVYKRTEKYELRPNQAETVKRFKEALEVGRTNLLMYAVMRFGKSFTSMCCALEMNANLVLIVSAKADVKQEWKKTIESHVKFADYRFMDSDALLEHGNILKDTLEKSKVVVFLTLQDLAGRKIKEKHKEIFEEEIDLLLIDETHYGARAEEYGRVLKLSSIDLKRELKGADRADDYEESEELKRLHSKVRIHLSGTPYRILMGSEFEKKDIIAFYQFTDIVKEQEQWDKEHLLDDNAKEWDNPYYGFPQMIRFAFLPNQSSINKMEALKKEGYSFALSELFRPQSISQCEEGLHQQFIYENEVLGLLQAIDGSKEDPNVLAFLDEEHIQKGEMCRHMVFVLPYRASCDAMEVLLNNHKEDFNHLNNYEIINITGLSNEKKYKSTSDVKAKIKKCEREGKKTITLTVNRMMTGSTVEEWDTMIFLKSCASPQEYDQAVFRLQNQYVRTLTNEREGTIKYNMKPQTLLVDFDPKRMFVLQELKSQIYNVNNDKQGNSRLEERIEEELRISPIVTIKESALQKVTSTNVMDAVRRYSKERSVLDEANDIPIDNLLLDNEIIRQAIANLSPIDNRKGLEIRPVEGEENDLPIQPQASGDEGEEAEEKPSEDMILPEKTDENNLDKKLVTYYAQILFLALLTESNVKSLEEVIEAINISEENKRIAKNVGLLEDILKIIQKNSNPFILSALDYKIQNINSLIRDESLRPEERVEIAMKKLGRLSSSEIVTSQPIVKEMVDLLPEEAVSSTSKILDIASKQGEFVRALYLKYGADIGRNVYSIPTSSISYELTLKVYRLLKLPEKNVFSDFTSYDLINKDINSKIMTQLKDINFDIVIGNPPYQINDGGGTGSSAKPIYHNFIQQAKKLNPRFLTMIIPARWFTGGKGLDAFRNEMLKDNRIKILHDYINANDCFPNVKIEGGTCYFLWDRDYNGSCEYHLHNSVGEVKNSQRILNEVRGIFVRYDEALDVLKKVKTFNEKSFSDLVSSRNPYGFSSDFIKKNKNILKNTKSNNDFELIGNLNRKRTIKYLSKTYSKIKSYDEIDQWRIFISKADGAAGQMGNPIPARIIGKPIVAKPYDICTETFLRVGPFKDESQARNAISYMQTKFFRFLVGIRKNKNMTQSTYSFVPIQDFSKPWTDEKLYEKYGLSDEEIAFIDSMIEPMNNNSTDDLLQDEIECVEEIIEPME